MNENNTLSASNIDQLARFAIEDSVSNEDLSETVAIYLENIAGCESLSHDDIDNLITAIKSKVIEIRQSNKEET